MAPRFFFAQNKYLKGENIFMEYYMKLPRSKKEFVLFMAVISIISVNIIAPLITCFEAGFSLENWGHALHVIPCLWPCVIALVLLTYRPAAYLTSRLVETEDSFKAHILINILCTVFLMSIVLTVLGTWIGCGAVTMEPIRMFFFKWPRNFAVSFAVESVIAQPIARLVMLQFHLRRDACSDTAQVLGHDAL